MLKKYCMLVMVLFHNVLVVYSVQDSFLFTMYWHNIQFINESTGYMFYFWARGMETSSMHKEIRMFELGWPAHKSIFMILC